MLNRAARYFPILRTLRERNLLASSSILEIGSGPIGLGEFHKATFVGCDVLFPVPPRPPMAPVIASAAALPFADRAFDVVIASDVLEHVPPPARQVVIHEALRVAKKLAVFGFPCGPVAHESDRKLLEEYVGADREPPVWLTEHMLAQFPEADVFNCVQGWEITDFGNENIRFHLRLMHMEIGRLFNYGALASLRLAPRWVEFLLRKADRPPYYRRIFVLSKRT